MLKDYLKEKGIECRMIQFNESTHSAREAAEQLGVPLEKIIKSVLFMVGDTPILCIVPGDKLVDEGRLRERFGVGRVRVATPSEVKDVTGYEIGEVPPIALRSFKVLVDSSLVGAGKVYGGGGSKSSILEIDVKDVVSLNGAEVLDITK